MYLHIGKHIGVILAPVPPVAPVATVAYISPCRSRKPITLKAKVDVPGRRCDGWHTTGDDSRDFKWLDTSQNVGFQPTQEKEIKPLNIEFQHKQGCNQPKYGFVQ